MRGVLKPIPATSPDVDPVRPGYAVHDPATDLFACAESDTIGPVTRNRTASVGWCGPRGPVTVWASLAAASTVATSLKATVVSVPRRNGYCLEWSVVAMVVEGHTTTTIVMGDSFGHQTPWGKAVSKSWGIP